MITIALLAIFFTVIISFVKKLYEKSLHFKKQNIKYITPLPIFGNCLEEFLGLKHESEIIERNYNSFPDEDIFGHYTFGLPQYVIRSPKIVELIMVKDFSHFTDRLVPTGPVRGPSEATMFHLCGLQWRATRNKFTPLFTSVKLKYMYQSIGQCGKYLEDLLDANDGQVLDMKDVMSRYTLDVIGSIAYGLDVNTLKNPDSSFKTMAYKIPEFGLLSQLRLLLVLSVPKIIRFLGLSGGFTSDSTTNYFCDIIRDALEHRKKSGIERPDFIQMMLTLKEKGKVDIQDHDSSDDYLFIDKSIDSKGVEISDDILIGGGFTFVFAGFHSSAMTLSYTLFELARHPKVLKRVKSELEQTLSGGVTYDNLKELKYLENVIKETLRFYPTVTFLGRVCTKEYTLPTGHLLKPEDRILIPVSALHKDPSYFPDPLVFNPDRFENNPVPGTFFPFGDGPRVCIGMRLAMMEMKYCLAKLLLKYNIELVDKPKPGPFKMEPRSFLTTPVGPIRMRVSKI